MPKKPKIVDPDTIEPLCPFTGEKLTLIRHDETGMWRAQGPFYFTRFFPYKRELVHALLTRNGIEPSFDKRPKVSTNEAPVYDNPVADQVAGFHKAQESADEFVDRNRDKWGLKK